MRKFVYIVSDGMLDIYKKIIYENHSNYCIIKYRERNFLSGDIVKETKKFSNEENHKILDKIESIPYKRKYSTNRSIETDIPKTSYKFYDDRVYILNSDMNLSSVYDAITDLIDYLQKLYKEEK